MIMGWNGQGYFSVENLYGSWNGTGKAFTVFGNGNVNADPMGMNSGFLNNGNTNGSGLTFGVGTEHRLERGVGIDHLTVLLVLEAVLLDVIPELLGELRAGKWLGADNGGKGIIGCYRFHERGVGFAG